MNERIIDSYVSTNIRNERIKTSYIFENDGKILAVFLRSGNYRR